MEPARTSPLRIFLCGTNFDLEAERQAARQAIERSRNEALSMELFGAHPDAPIETCLAHVAQCDIMIVIVGHRYGEIVPGRSRSFSETEYRYGYKLRKPMYVYFQKNIPDNPAFIEDDPDKIDKLKRWKRTLQLRHYPDYYGPVWEFSNSISRTISTLVNLSTRPPNTSEGDSIYLAQEQACDLKAVWVYAPHPLETMPDGFHTEIRMQVVRNLLAGVKYVYFVESEVGIERIARLAKRLASLTGHDFEESLAIIKKNIEICVLDEFSFLTHYTVHVGGGGAIDVYQSVLDPDRKDRVTKLSAPVARATYERIGAKFRDSEKSRVGGLLVRRGRRHSQ